MEKKRDLKERTFNFSKKSIDLVNKLPKNIVNQTLGKQYLNAATSIGANYREADGAESPRDFLHKTGVIIKEAKESLYWLGLIKYNNKALEIDVDKLICEAKELILIFSKISLNVKAKLKP